MIYRHIAVIYRQNGVEYFYLVISFMIWTTVTQSIYSLCVQSIEFSLIDDERHTQHLMRITHGSCLGTRPKPIDIVNTRPHSTLEIIVLCSQAKYCVISHWHLSTACVYAVRLCVHRIDLSMYSIWQHLPMVCRGGGGKTHRYPHDYRFCLSASKSVTFDTYKFDSYPIKFKQRKS